MAALGLLPFHWRDEVPRLAAESAAIDAVATAVSTTPPDFHGTLPAPSRWLTSARSSGPGLSVLDIAPHDARATSWTVNASFAQSLPAGVAVNLLFKPFASNHDWTALPMTPSDSGYVATVPGTGEGAMFAVEVGGAIEEGWRYPDVIEETPYRTLAP
jgi:hypothetical protein